MGWRGIVRSVAAASRKAAREAERQQKIINKEHAVMAARTSVAEFEQHLERVQSLHTTTSINDDWEAHRLAEEPIPPINRQEREKQTAAILESFRPNFWHKTFGLTQRKISSLKTAILKAQLNDQAEFEEESRKFKEAHESWERMRALAERLVAGENSAMQEAIDTHSEVLSALPVGLSMSFEILNKTLIRCQLHLSNEDDVIPKNRPKALASGGVSYKPIPKTECNETYANHVCSASFRLVRELLNLLPSIQTVIITGFAEQVDPRSGHLEKVPLISMACVRSTIQRMNFQSISPLSAVENFIHNIRYSRTKGLSPVTEVEVPEVSSH